MATCPDIVKRLIEHFDQQADQVRSSDFNETQLRIDFVNPMFAALGWDLDNNQGFAEQYREVVHEDRVKVGGQTKAPDYSFRVGGTRKFFLEAKKPFVNIKTDWEPAYQLRRYGWSAKLAVSLLTDFEELAVYDCRITPKLFDKASVARREYLTYHDYPSRWDFIEGTFSKRAVLQGEFDRYCQTAKGRGAQEFDDAFLEEIEEWRKKLASNLALRNGSLDERSLNFAVQRIIDRIIFLRICEDRAIEHTGQLQSLLSGEAVYPRLFKLFHNADERFNSGLFHFKAEKDRGESPDELTEKLDIDDATLKSIISRLYYPESPYEFTVVSADILGSVYERFLGKVITLTSAHRAKVEEKPEVRKAGGVYYTPTYIVDYIVQNTVGKLLGSSQSPGSPSERSTPSPGTPGEGEGEGLAMTPKDASKLKILDPACGSGSFLLGAYQYLLDWHLKWFIADGPEKWNKGKSATLRPGPSGDWRLTIKERKRILLDNIHGVDIDFQAVEVTKLSLLLRVLEGETAESLGGLWKLFRERALPDLGSNIQCGNSLIGSDIMTTDAWKEMSEDERRRVNAFDFKRAFAKVFRQGGFDAVIGNPPYIRIQTLQESAPVEVEFYKQRYVAAGQGNYDIYVVFVERGLDLLAPLARLGFILPHKFFNAQYGRPLRQVLSEGRNLSHIVYFGDQQVFEHATTYTCMMFLDKAGSQNCRIIRVKDLKAWRSDGVGIEGSVTNAAITASEWNFSVGNGAALFNKLSDTGTSFGEVASRIAQGIRTSANEVYVLDVVSAKAKTVEARSALTDEIVKLEREAITWFLQGREIKKYRILPSGKVVIIPYRLEDGRAVLIEESEFRRRFPKAYAYLHQNKAHLERRESGRMRGASWYAYVYPKNIELMGMPKILVPDIADRAAFAFDEEGSYAFTSGYGITLKTDVMESPKYVLGLLNSQVLNFFLKRISTPLRGGFFRYFTQFIEQLPIRRIDFASPADKSKHDALVSLVESMLSLQKRIRETATPQEVDVFGRQADATDRQIDQLVYELYGLTDDEIRIMEEATK